MNLLLHQNNNRDEMVLHSTDRRRVSSTNYTFVLFLTLLVGCSARGQLVENVDLSETCGADELNHSTLVECNATSNQCSDSRAAGQIWPREPGEIVHIISTRDGARFERKILENLNLEEEERERSLNINTTIYVKDQPISNINDRRIIGFGATLNLHELTSGADHLETASLEQANSPILGDLFSKLSAGGARLDILRLPIEAGIVAGTNISDLLFRLDNQVARIRGYSGAPLKLLLDFTRYRTTSDLLSSLRSISSSLANLSSLEIWSLALGRGEQFSPTGQDYEHELLVSISKMFPSNVRLYRSVSYSEAADVSDAMANSRQQSKFQGLLLGPKPNSVPYNTLAYLSGVRTSTTDARDPSSCCKLDLLAIGAKKNRPGSQGYGDWQNAQNYAVELLNNLRYGADGFIEQVSVVDALGAINEVQVSDGSLYSLQRSHGLHFRGPMFYALGHFSRHIVPGSRRLDVDVFTQPNMFAAHYSAFKTPNNHLVAVVLNDNEHMLPFRLAYNDKIMAHAYLGPKSFNTMILKL